MRIIKPGKLPAEEIMTGKCLNCGAEIECTKEEAKSYSDGSNGYDYSVNCPTQGCKAAVFLYKSRHQSNFHQMKRFTDSMTINIFAKRS